MLKFCQKTTNFVQILCRKKMSMIKRIIAVTCLGAILLCSCSRKDYVRITGYAQGGTYSIKCSIPNGKGARWVQQVKDSVDHVLYAIDNAVSGYNKNSLLSRYNSSGSLSDDGSLEYRIFCHLQDYCDSLYLETDGALDTRAAELFDIWGFGFKNGSMPSDGQVEQAMKNRSRMNFNAVAQGYSADMVAEVLMRNGVTDFLVDIGGEMACMGLNPAGKNWTIGIDAPKDGNFSPGEDITGTFSLPGSRYCGVVTSGNYRKFYIKDGVKYSHTVDPRTGRPVTHDLLCATILAPTSALADALATYCMVIGFDQASEFIESRDDLEGCLITSSGNWCSSGFSLNEDL